MQAIFKLELIRQVKLHSCTKLANLNMISPPFFSFRLILTLLLSQKVVILTNHSVDFRTSSFFPVNWARKVILNRTFTESMVSRSFFNELKKNTNPKSGFYPLNSHRKAYLQYEQTGNAWITFSESMDKVQGNPQHRTNT